MNCYTLLTIDVDLGTGLPASEIGVAAVDADVGDGGAGGRP